MDEFVTVATYDSLPIAELARGRLQEAGILAVLADANLIAMHSLLSNAVGGIKLRVRRADADQAVTLLSSVSTQRQPHASETLARIRFYCSECQAVLDFPSARRGGVESCESCGEFVDVPDCSDATLVAADGSPIELATAEPVETPSQRRLPLLLEIPAVLSFVYLPHVIHGLPAFNYLPSDLSADMALILVGAIQVMVPLLLIIALGGEGWKKFGIVPFHLGFDCSLAFVIWFVDNLVLTFTYTPFATASSEPIPTEVSISSWQTGLMCLLGLSANSLAEELAMRGYLITRLEELWRSRLAAVSVSAVLFASYHAYQGLTATVSIGITGLIYGLFYLWLRRLWPLVIAHTAYNLAIYL